MNSDSSPSHAGIAERHRRTGQLAVLAAFVVIVVANWSYFTAPRIVEIGDLAANGLQVEAAKRLQEIDGPYSRIHQRHPGPAIFYLEAVGDRVFRFLPSPLSRYRMTLLIFHLICLSVIGRGVTQMFSSRLLGVAGPVVVLAGSAAALGESPLSLVTSAWGPDSTALAAAAALMLCARFWHERRLTQYFGALVLLSYAVQTQMANVVAAGPLAVVVTILLVVYLARGQLADRVLEPVNLVLMAVLVLQNLFFLAHLVDWENSGLRLLVEHLSRTAGMHHTVSDGSNFLLGMTWKTGSGVWPFGGGGAPETANGAAKVVVMLLVLWTAHALVARGPSLAGRLVILSWLVLACSGGGATRIDGPLMPHLFSYVPGALVLLVISLLAAQPRVAFGHSGVLFIVLAVSSITVVDLLQERLTVPETPGWVPVLETELDPSRQPVVEVALDKRGDDRLWSTYTGIVLELRRRGFQVRTARDWNFLVAHGVPASRGEVRDVVHLVQTPDGTPTDDPFSVALPNGVLRVYHDLGDAELQERRISAASLDLLPLVVGRNYRYDDKNLLMTGWYAGNGAFRWSAGDSSSIHFKRPAAPRAANYGLTVHAGAYGRQVVDFLLNGQHLDRVTLQGFQQRDIVLAVRGDQLTEDGVNELCMRFSNPGPAEPGSTRMLAVNFVSLRLDPSDPDG